jgi:anti-sigma B factor antagonist
VAHDQTNLAFSTRVNFEELVSNHFAVEQTGPTAIVTIHGTLDINSAPQLAERIDQLMATRPSQVSVDLSKLELIDSSGVAALVKLYKGVRGLGGTFLVTGARDQPLAIFKLLRMDKVFNLQ